MTYCTTGCQKTWRYSNAVYNLAWSCYGFSLLTLGGRRFKCSSSSWCEKVGKFYYVDMHMYMNILLCMVHQFQHIAGWRHESKDWGLWFCYGTSWMCFGEEEFHTHIHGVWYYWLHGTRSASWRDGAQERCVFIWCSKAVTSICSQFKCYDYFICTIHRWSWRFIVSSVLMTKTGRYLCWYYE